MLNSRSLTVLEPKFANLVNRWLQGCSDIGLDILIVNTYRDNDYQNWLYASGRTREGRIVTMARGGESKHNKNPCEALDFCVMDGKRCDWNNISDFTRAGHLAVALGLVWAGNWNGKLKEVGHIESF